MLRTSGMLRNPASNLGWPPAAFNETDEFETEVSDHTTRARHITKVTDLRRLLSRS
jgi:hypothetical protein